MANVVVLALAVYVGVGVAFALPFLWRGVGRIDPAAAGCGVGFRAIIAPGVVALWPLLARRWLAGQLPPEERNAHRAAAGDPAP